MASNQKISSWSRKESPMIEMIANDRKRLESQSASDPLVKVLVRIPENGGGLLGRFLCVFRYLHDRFHVY
jgi:hypothetical protein